MPHGSAQSGLRAVAPGAEADLRGVFGQFATGVTVVTVQTATGPLGMTANSFSSVSLTPPLLLWCPAKSSSRFGAFRTAAHFAIHVLDAEQAAVAMSFARQGDAFDGLDTEISAQGVPLLRDCLARFECRTHALHDAGDHALILGEVTAAATRPGAPLIFFEGGFASFDTGPQKPNE